MAKSNPVLCMHSTHVAVQLPDHAARDGRHDPCFVAQYYAVEGVPGRVGGSIGRLVSIGVHGLGYFAKDAAELLTKRARNLGGTRHELVALCVSSLKSAA